MKLAVCPTIENVSTHHINGLQILRREAFFKALIFPVAEMFAVLAQLHGHPFLGLVMLLIC
jgi:hypothetical protein